MRQRGLHAPRLRGITFPANHRIEPHDALAAPRQLPHLPVHCLGWPSVVAVRDDHYAGARVDDTAGIPAVERREALSDACAAANALRQQRKSFERAADILLAHCSRHVDETCVEEEGLRGSEVVKYAMDESHEYGRVEAHGARGVEQHHEPQWLAFALAPQQLNRDPAVRNITANSAA